MTQQPEMEPEYRLTPEEKAETNRVYKKAFYVSVALAIPLLIAVVILPLLMREWFGLAHGKGSSSGLGAICMSFTQMLATILCRRWGVSREARFRERWNVALGAGNRSPASFVAADGRGPLVLRRSRVLPGLLAGSGVLFVALLVFLLLRPRESDSTYLAITGAGIMGALWGAVLLVWGNRAEAVLDESGVGLAARPWYIPGKGMRRIFWEEIDRVDIVRERGVKGEDLGGSLTVTTRDGTASRVSLGFAAPEDRVPFLNRLRASARVDEKVLIDVAATESAGDFAVTTVEAVRENPAQETQQQVLVRGAR